MTERTQNLQAACLRGRESKRVWDTSLEGFAHMGAKSKRVLACGHEPRCTTQSQSEIGDPGPFFLVV